MYPEMQRVYFISTAALISTFMVLLSYVPLPDFVVLLPGAA